MLSHYKPSPRSVSSSSHSAVSTSSYWTPREHDRDSSVLLNAGEHATPAHTPIHAAAASASHAHAHAHLQSHQHQFSQNNQFSQYYQTHSSFQSPVSSQSSPFPSPSFPVAPSTPVPSTLPSPPRAALTPSLIDELMKAARHGHYAAVEQYLAAGVPVDVMDANGNTILIVACQNNNKRCLKLALRQGANINHQNLRGNTALHYCYTFQYHALVDYLLSKQADPHIKNQKGRTPQHGIGGDDNVNNTLST